MMLFELDGCEVIEARMRSNCIVVSTPGFDDHLGFASAAEPLDAQTLIAEATVKA